MSAEERELRARLAAHAMHARNDSRAVTANARRAFFDRFDGAFPTINSYDADCFTGWAEWSGTSFAAPVVVAAVARELVCGLDPSGGILDAVTAVERVVRAPHLARLPCLGTVVNL